MCDTIINYYSTRYYTSMTVRLVASISLKVGNFIYHRAVKLSSIKCVDLFVMKLCVIYEKVMRIL